VHGNQILCLGSRSGAVLLKFNRTKDGFVPDASTSRPALFQSWLDSVVVIGEHMYSYGEGQLACIKVNDGSLLWRVRLQEARASRAAITCADGRLYVRCQEGKTLLIEVSPKGHQIRGTFQQPRLTNNPAWSFPVVTGDRLYLRDQHALFCYDVTQHALEKQRREPKTVVLQPPAPRAVSDRRPSSRTLRSIFVPTPQDIVVKMLELADVTDTDMLCDLGSGDGRILITAAKKYGCRAVGYEIDRELVAQSRENATKAGVGQLVQIEHKDLFTADLSTADVIALYLLPSQLEKLVPQLETLKAGSRIVSHEFEIRGIEPHKSIEIESQDDGNLHKVYLWTTPLKKE
jgi:precorrin-6B methylase 2